MLASTYHDHFNYIIVYQHCLLVLYCRSLIQSVLVYAIMLCVCVGVCVYSCFVLLIVHKRKTAAATVNKAKRFKLDSEEQNDTTQKLEAQNKKVVECRTNIAVCETQLEALRYNEC